MCKLELLFLDPTGEGVPLKNKHILVVLCPNRKAFTPCPQKMQTNSSCAN